MINKTSAASPSEIPRPKQRPQSLNNQTSSDPSSPIQANLSPRDQAQTPTFSAAKQTPEIVALVDDADSVAPTLADVRQGAVIELGMSGESVTAVQKLLSDKGFSVAATGTLGDSTAGQISAFQKDRGLEEDGRIGRNTLAALESSGKSSGNLDAEINQLKTQFVKRGKVSANRTRALGNAIDQMLSKPDVRKALIERFDLGSATNRKALVAVTAIESGSNGDMGEVMTAVINRALVKNLVREITGIGGRSSVMDVVNEGNQFSSKAGVRRIMNGGDTGQKHYANFKQPAEAVVTQVLDGKHTFKNNASKIYYFDQGGAKHQFKIGVHRFREGYAGKSTHYVQDELQTRNRLNW